MDNAAVTEPSVEKKKKKKDKVRSAWISFAGRIVAQMVGAIATVALGVMVLHRYTATDTQPPGHPPAAEIGYATYAQPGHPSAGAALGTPAAASGGPHSQRPIVIVLSQGTCGPALDAPATSAAHLDNGTFLPR